jgi:putative membrane protein
MTINALVMLAQATNAGAEGLSVSALVRGVVGSLVYSTVGLVMFAIAFFIINKTVPFSIRKEIEDDQNTSLGIVIAAVIIGIAMIVSAAVHG